MKTRSKIILYSFLLLLWLGLLAGFLVYLFWSSVQTKSAQLKQKQEKIAEVETQSRQLQDLQQSLDEAEPLFATIDSLFINKEAPVAFLEFLEETAAESDLDINITPSAGDKEEKEPWPPTFFEINGVGDFKQGAEFVKKLKYAPYLMEIQRLDFQKKEKNSKKGKVQLNLLIKVY